MEITSKSATQTTTVCSITSSFEALDESHCQTLLDLLKESDHADIQGRASEFDDLVMSYASTLGITYAYHTRLLALPDDGAL